MAYSCLKSLNVCAVRASILDADGSPDFSLANGSAYDLSPITLGRTAISTTTTGITQEDGCGRICLSIPDTTTTTGETLSLVLCQLNLELISLLTGAEVILDGSLDVIGFIAPDPSAAKPVIEFNGWSNAYSGNAPSAAPYTNYHWVWPYTQWTIADWTLQRGILQVSVTGTATANANIGTGTFADFPVAIDQFFGVFLADDLPDPDVAPYDENVDGCGFIDSPAS
jgi:hypothetical protein